MMSFFRREGEINTKTLGIKAMGRKKWGQKLELHIYMPRNTKDCPQLLEAMRGV